MRSINLDQLRTFVEVVSQGNFSAAGRRLNLTQPAVSLHVRELEKRFGLRLLQRAGRRAFPTAPGMDLAAHARRIFHDCELIDSTMRRFREGWLGRVRIGTTLTALTYVLPPILRKVRMEHPGIDLIVTQLSTRDSVDSVKCRGASTRVPARFCAEYPARLIRPFTANVPSRRSRLSSAPAASSRVSPERAIRLSIAVPSDRY